MSNNLNLVRVTAAQNQKEVTINDQAEGIDAAITESLSVVASAGALSIEQYTRNFSFTFTGGTTPQTIQLPTNKRLFNVRNAGTAALTVAVAGGVGSGVAIAAGASALLFSNGVDVTLLTSGAALDKNAVGLGNVDNTSDANKPVSTAQAAAIEEAKNAPTRVSGIAPVMRADGVTTAQVRTVLTPAQINIPGTAPAYIVFRSGVRPNPLTRLNSILKFSGHRQNGASGIAMDCTIGIGQQVTDFNSWTRLVHHGADRPEVRTAVDSSNRLCIIFAYSAGASELSIALDKVTSGGVTGSEEFLLGWSAGTVTSLSEFSTTYLQNDAGFQPQIDAKAPSNNPVFAGTVSAGTYAADGAAGSHRTYQFRTGGLSRWQMGANSAAESGGNAGSNFELRRYNDAGTGPAVALSADRATGQVTIPSLVAASPSFSGTSVNPVRSTGPIVIQNGAATGALLVGADTNNNTLTDGLAKIGRITHPAYSSATVPPFIMLAGQAGTTLNVLGVGGLPGASATAATQIDFTTALDNTTTGGTRQWVVQNDGHFRPGIDNSNTIGRPGQRAANVYSYGGDFAAPVKFGVYDFASRPAASAYADFYCTLLTGGVRRLCRSDGTNWIVEATGMPAS